MARELLRTEGILAGSSTGTLLAGALRYCRQQTEKKRVVTFVCDTGNKYLSKMYNDFWMADQGFGQRPSHGDLSDLDFTSLRSRRSHFGRAGRHLAYGREAHARRGHFAGAGRG